MIVAVLLSYMHVAFSLVTDDSPSWMTALAGCSSAAVGIGLTPIANRRAENRLKAMREHDLE